MASTVETIVEASLEGEDETARAFEVVWGAFFGPKELWEGEAEDTDVYMPDDWTATYEGAGIDRDTDPDERVRFTAAINVTPRQLYDGSALREPPCGDLSPAYIGLNGPRFPETY